jgi:hypothetical protein
MSDLPFSQLFRDIATAPRDETTIEVKHGIHQQIVRAVWSEQNQSFVCEGDPHWLTLHRVTGWRPVVSIGYLPR